MSDEEALKLATTFEREYPTAFHHCQTMLREHDSGMNLVNYIREVCRIGLHEAAMIRQALRITT